MAVIRTAVRKADAYEAVHEITGGTICGGASRPNAAVLRIFHPRFPASRESVESRAGAGGWAQPCRRGSHSIRLKRQHGRKLRAPTQRSLSIFQKLPGRPERHIVRQIS